MSRIVIHTIQRDNGVVNIFLVILVDEAVEPVDQWQQQITFSSSKAILLRVIGC